MEILLFSLSCHDERRGSDDGIVPSWAELNRRVANRHPMTQKELDDWTEDEWNRFPQAMINKYVKSFAKKCARCARRGGKC